MVKLLLKILKVLNSETDPAQISLGLCFALISGISPLLSLHNLIVLLLVLVLRVNLSMFLVGTFFFSGIAYIFDPLISRVGYAALTTEGLAGFWTTLYNIPVFRADNFNNSIVMGGLIISLLLFIPCYFIFNTLIIKYRKHILAWVQKSKLVQGLKASKFYQIYDSLSGWDFK